jgi:hypothetical protein
MPFADTTEQESTGIPLRYVASHPAGAFVFLPEDCTRQPQHWRERRAARPLLDSTHGFGHSRRARRRQRSQYPCLWCIDGRHDCPGIRRTVSGACAVSHSRLHSRRRTECQARQTRRRRDAESRLPDEPEQAAFQARNSSCSNAPVIGFRPISPRPRKERSSNSWPRNRSVQTQAKRGPKSMELISHRRSQAHPPVGCLIPSEHITPSIKFI